MPFKPTKCLGGREAKMKYTSTRDASISCSFEQALTGGYAPDGGLFVPEQLPQLSASTLQAWSKLSFPALAQEFLRLMVSEDELSNEELASICKAAYDGAFPPEAIPLKKVISKAYIAELSHGPTFCFKDFGMRIVISLMSHFCRRGNFSVRLLVGTTGDTGPAALQAVADMENSNLTMVVFYPVGQISDFQRKQLTTSTSEQVRVVEFEGGGDDMDDPIKVLTSEQRKDIWTGVNSYNIGRPLMQAAHFVYIYLNACKAEGISPGDTSQPVDVVIPTGAMGNIGEFLSVLACWTDDYSLSVVFLEYPANSFTTPLKLVPTLPRLWEYPSASFNRA